MRRYHSYLLAGTALIGISTLGAGNPALAACTGTGPLTCSGATTANQVNTGLIAPPLTTIPNASVVFDSTAVIDTSAGSGGNVYISYVNGYNGGVSFTNSGVVGKTDGSTDALGLIILGDRSTTANVATITNSGTVYGILNIGGIDPTAIPGFTATDPVATATTNRPVGGSGTITLTGPVIDPLSPVAGVQGSVGIWSVGDAILTTSGAATISGPVGLLSRITTDTPATLTTYHTTVQTGGRAVATIGADVGYLDTTVTGLFVGQPISLTGATEADLTIQSPARTGNVTLRAGVTNTVAGTLFSTDTAGNSVATTKTFTDKLNQGSANLAVDAGAQLLGVASIIGWGNATATINGTVGTGPAAGTVLTVSSPQSSTEVTTTLVVSPAAAELSNTTVSATIPSGGAVTLTVNAGAVVNGRVSATATKDLNVTILGKVGGLKDDGSPVSGNITLAQTSQSFTSTTTVNKSAIGNFLTESDTKNDWQFPVLGNINVGVGTTGNVHGSITATAHGNIVGAIDGTVGDFLIPAANGLTFTNNGNWIETITDNKTYDGTVATTLIRETMSDDNKVLGSTINLTISSTGVVNGPVVLNSFAGITVVNNGSIAGSATGPTPGSLTANSNSGPGFLTKNNLTYTLTPTVGTGTVDNLYTRSTDRVTQSIGGAVSITNTSLKSIQGPVNVNAVGDVTFNNSGWAIGPVTLISNGLMSETIDNKSFDSLVTQVDAADPTKGATSTAHYIDASTVVNTVTGGNINSNLSGLTGVTDTAIDLVAVAVSPVPGTNFITQAANANSTLVIPTTGTAFLNIGVGAGVSAIGALTTGTSGSFAIGANNAGFVAATNSSVTTNIDNSFALGLDGAGNATLTTVNGGTGSMSLSNHTVTTTSVLSNSVASLDVQGLISKQFNNLNPQALKNNTVFVYGPGGAKITVSGNDQGTASAGAAAATLGAANANTTVDVNTTQTFRVLSFGTNNPSGVLIANTKGAFVETSFSTESNTITKAAGAAASVAATGTGAIGASANAIGLTGSTVTVDANASAGGAVAVIEALSIDNSLDIKTARVYGGDPNPFKYVQTDTTTTAIAPSALAGNASVTANGAIKNGTVVVGAPTGTATATLKGNVAYNDAAAGDVTGTSKLATVTVISASGGVAPALGLANAYQYKYNKTEATVWAGFTNAVNVAAGAPTLPVTVPPFGTAPAFAAPAITAADDKVTYNSKETKVSVGNAATASLTAPAATAADPTKDYVNNTVTVIGDKSATLTVAAGTRIGGLATVTSLPQSFLNTIDQTYKNVSTITIPLSNASMDYRLDTDVRDTEIHYTGGTASATNAGQIRGGVSITSAGTATSTLTNTGMLGALNNLVTGSGPGNARGYLASASFVSSIQSDFVQKMTSTNLTDPDHSQIVTVSTYTGVGGTATATNSGTIVGSLQIAGKTGTVTNTGSLGSNGAATGIFTPTNPIAAGPGAGAFAQVGRGLGGLVLGQSIQHYTQTVTQTPGSATFTDVSTPFVQTITANQNGLLAGGIVVGSATSQSVAGSGGSNLTPGQFNGVLEDVIDQAQSTANPAQPANLSNNGTVVKTTTINATINIGDNSLTLGGALAGDPGGANAPGTYAILGQRNVSQAAQTTTNVNLNGNNWIGAHLDESLNDKDGDEGFQVAPKLTVDQYAFLYATYGGTTPQTFLNGYEMHVPAAIVGVNNLIRTAGGTTYFTGAGFDDRGTPTPFDDFYDIQATNFTINAGGEAQFANLGPKDEIPEGSRPIDHNPYGIKGAVSNSGTFVMGARIQSTLLPNLTSVLAPQTEFINGVNFRVDGNFTQTSTGTAVLTVFPALMRPTNPGFVGLTAPELLARPAGGVAFLPFTTANNFIGNTMGFLPDVSYMTINGNLTLAGTIQVDTLRDSLYVGGSSIPVFTVNGTATLSSPVVATTFSSPFVGFGVTSAAGPVAGQTIVSVVVNRSSYASAAQSQDERAAALALDADLPGVVQKITDDANGKKVFSSVQEFIRVQDEATIMAGLDWQLSAPDASRALKDLSGNGQYGSLMALDHTRDLANTFEDYFGAATPMDAPGVTWWLTPTYRGTDFDGSNSRGAADMRSDQLGLLAGAQVRMSPNWGAGAGIGYGHDRATVSDAGHTNINTFMVGGNVHYAGDQFNIGVQLDYGYNTYNSDRDLPFLARATDASFNGHELRGRIEGGWRVPLSGGANGTLLPYIALDIIDREIHGFKESTVRGGGIALNVDSQSDTEFDPKLGVRWNGAGWNTGMFVLAPLADLTYTFSDPSTGSDLGFAGGTTTFHTLGVNPGGFVTIQGGLFGAIGSAGSLGIKAGGDFGSNRTGAMGSLVFRMQL